MHLLMSTRSSNTATRLTETHAAASSITSLVSCQHALVEWCQIQPIGHLTFQTSAWLHKNVKLSTITVLAQIVMELLLCHHHQQQKRPRSMKLYFWIRMVYAWEAMIKWRLLIKTVCKLDLQSMKLDFWGTYHKMSAVSEVYPNLNFSLHVRQLKLLENLTMSGMN